MVSDDGTIRVGRGTLKAMHSCAYCSAGTTGDFVDMKGRPICGGCRRDKIAPFKKAAHRVAVEKRAAEEKRATEEKAKSRQPIKDLVDSLGDEGLHLRLLLSKRGSA